MTIKPSVSISRIIFSGGQSFDLMPDEKIIIVGPNNSGKSQSLRDIVAICQNGAQGRTAVLEKIELKKVGTQEELRCFLESNSDLVDGTFRFKRWQINSNHIQFWDSEFLIHGLADGFVQNISANERLTICDQQNSIASGQQKSRPQHVLYDDDSLMRKVSRLFKQAFGKDLMFDFRGGSRLPIYVGELPSPEVSQDRVSDAYVNAIRSNPLLDKQGDGMRSFAGILFEAVVSNLDITLIDEPEAFLHPPQMRRLGEILASEVNGQLIVATHSSDILHGFLEATKGKIRILRIERIEDKNHVAEAPADTVQSLWEKPELRYSNALDGIFHEQTIICEDDSDCRLINSISDHLEVELGEQWQDTAYVPTGGKHGIPKIASVLRKIGVPVKCVFDLDFLSEQFLVQETVEACGGDWDDFKPLWVRLDAAVRGGNKAKTLPEIQEEITNILSVASVENLPHRKVLDVLKQNRPWVSVKKYGELGIPNGDAQSDYASLRAKLADLGIYMVPVGEIENFCQQIGSHGPKFVSKLLTTMKLDDQRLDRLRTFVESVHKGKACRN